MAGMFSIGAYAQNVTVSGNVRSSTSKESVPAVSVTVKGSSVGTYTDDKGNFKITVAKLPATLVFSSVGYENKEVNITSAAESITVDFVPSSTLGQEIVVAATRTPQRILESPVTIERMNNIFIKNAPAPNYYEALANFKGVDMHTASLTFRTITTRGFVASGNTRLNQLIDGMDNQAPGLNFSVGSVIGLTELDVDNIELLSGASSALYGSGGMNGTVLMTSKNPFKYQGLSYNIKMGVNYIDNKHGKISPYYDWGVRYAKAYKKWAFKLAAQFIKAKDWTADDYRNTLRTNVLSKVIGGDRSNDPNYDGINTYGDETSALINDRSFGNAGNLLYQFAGALIGVYPSLTTQLLQLRQQYSYTNPAFIYNPIYVSRTGYEEKALVDYNTLNFKFTGGLHYMITPNIEASWDSYMGTGTTVYTGADRYSLRNLKMAQHKLEIRHKNWFVRGYTTQENAGESYNATVLGRLMNEYWKPTVTFTNGVATPQPTDWLVQYISAFLLYKANLMAGNVPPDDYNAHAFARSQADVGRLIPGTAAFDAAFKAVRAKPIPYGALFLDRTDLWAADGQLNISDQFRFSKIIEVIAGANIKEYVLNSQGTLFADHGSMFPGTINVAEYGGFMQLKRSFIHDIITLTAAGRYDKHKNFEGRFTPRFTAVLKVARNNFLRFSYQTAYRFPTNQDQYINLNTSSSILIGGIKEFQDFYALNVNTYTAESVVAARTAGNPTLLIPSTFNRLKPETMSSYEAGYKGLLGKKFLVDAYVYFSKYQNFLARKAVVKGVGGTNPLLVMNPLTSQNFSWEENIDQEVQTFGWGIGGEYNLPRNFVLYGNVFSDELHNVPAGFVTFFNAPHYRWNIGLRNENVYKNIGFNVVVKWQDNNFYEGTFATGTLPFFTWVDAQVSYRMPKTKNTFKIGGTNVGNSYYRQGFGSPYVGGLYYVSFGYNL